MPATEQTWRDQKRLHLVFGVSSVILLLSTVWMFVKDFRREWKPYQAKFRDIEMQMTQWREYQYATTEADQERQGLQRDLENELQRPFSGDEVKRFEELYQQHQSHMERLEADVYQADFSELGDVRKRIEKLQQDEQEASQTFIDAQLAADEAAVTSQSQAEPAAEAGELQRRADEARENLEAVQQEIREEFPKLRQRQHQALAAIVQRARFQEELLLRNRKFESADLDAAKANLGLAVRDSMAESPEGREVVLERQSEVDRLQANVAHLTEQYQAAADHRQKIQSALAEMTAEEDRIRKALADNQLELDNLENTLKSLRSEFFGSYGIGKRWLEMPILDAFNSPLKIENLWAEGLDQDYNFSRVRRFDRCTTCHQGIDKTMPGTPDVPAYPPRRSLQLVLSTDPPEPEEDEAADGGTEEEGSGEPSTADEAEGTVEAPADGGDALSDKIELVADVYGLRFAREGLVDQNEITVAFVEPRSLGAQAAVARPDSGPVMGAQLQEEMLKSHADTHQTVRPGLIVGDVIEAVNGDRFSSVERLIYRLADALGSGEPLTLSVQRGLPSPYASHPRLDLFVGSMSPHKLSDFACTVCHDGQGSATEFRWASHTPNTPKQQDEWTTEYGWFDNHHWIYPMYPQRFAESGCVKCHHEVTELRPSQRYPQPPAPKLVRGQELILKYGCYGCHEINGYEGDKRIGPDMRTEPNFFGAALLIKSLPEFLELPEDQQQLVHELIDHPERDDVRHALTEVIIQDKLAEAPLFAPETRDRIEALLKDVESPGSLRRPGPSMRYVASKNDSQFLYDWIHKPSHFRPTTRMPQFFGLWNHLDADSRELSERLEPVEILVMAAYLQSKSVPFEYVEPPEGISPTTPEEAVARGKILFQERGCLACHSHPDFPEMADYREPGAIQQGPDLGGLGSKFDPQRNPNGRRWLYSWIKEPTRYHARTVMPNLFLEPLEVKQGDQTLVTDPAADIVEYLMSSTKDDWQVDVPQFEEGALDELTMMYLSDAFYETKARDALQRGVPEREKGDLKGPEMALVVPDADYDARQPLTPQQKKIYAGSKTIAKYGCYGCHDIPGFEDAKPIGTGLADWGRKEPSKLAFEHILEYLHGGHYADEPLPAKQPVEEVVEHEGNVYLDEHASEEHGHDYPAYFMSQLNAGNRIGFMYQKLREPRSYDYYKTENKKYNERLRMPLFPLDDEEREAVMTFVLGLVADPPRDKYIYQPDDHQRALIEGRQVLEKYNCSGCHMIEPQQWDMALEPGALGPQTAGTTYPFVKRDYTPAEIIESATPDRRNRVPASLTGMPRLTDQGPPMIMDDFNDPLYDDEQYRPESLTYYFDLWQQTLIDGHPYMTGESAIRLPAEQTVARHSAWGGDLARYLIGPVARREREVNSSAKANEAWGWLPPPLHGEGRKVQTDWLHNFLLEPYMIRPATVLRMPKFNMSPEEATKLVHFFAAKDDAVFPYSYSDRREPERLERLDRQYRQEHGGEPGERLRAAMKIVTSASYCVKCHSVADAVTTAAPKAQAPNLAQVYERLRPDFVRQWIAKPNSVLPYTAMPVNVPYDPDKPFLGTTVPQDLYHGTSVQQLDALVDLMMNYDHYAKQQALIAPLVEQAKAADPAAGDAATGDAATGDAATGDAATADAASGGTAAGDDN